MENVQTFLDVYERARQLGLSEDELRALILDADATQGRLLDLVAGGKVTSVAEIEPPA